MESVELKAGLGQELRIDSGLFELTPEDQGWLDSYGVNPAWQANHALCKSLNEVIEVGSLRLDESVNQDHWQAVVSARRNFMVFIGITEDFIDAFQVEHPTIIPLDTFIKTQRVMTALGLDAAKVVNAMPQAIGLAPESVRDKMANLTALGLDAAKVVNATPQAIGYAPESVRDKMANLTALGLDAAKVVNARPQAIGLAPESVRDKMANLTALGLDAAKVVNARPPAIGYAPESVRDKMANLTALGLDAAKVVNAMPQAIGLAPESVRDKMANLTALGLDAAKVVNATPPAIGYAPESVRDKVRFLQRSAKILKWQYTAEDLVNTYPALLGFSTQKLAILRRIAANRVDSTARTDSPEIMRTILITPLEKYIVALSSVEENKTLSLSELSKISRHLKLSSVERKEWAAGVAPTMGRIGSMYLNYRNKAKE